MKKKVYLSGRMSGLEEEEFKAIFKKAEMELIERGYEVINPCEIDYAVEGYAGQLLSALGELAKCDAIYMLNNWKESNGARCEYWFAKGMGIEIVNESITCSLDKCKTGQLVRNAINHLIEEVSGTKF